MIVGRYVKNGEVTEIEVDNGLEEIVPEIPELKAVTMMPKKPVRYRRIESLTMGDAAALGIAAGGTLAGLWIAFIHTAGMPLTQAILIGIMAYDAIMLIENLTKWKEKR